MSIVAGDTKAIRRPTGSLGSAIKARIRYARHQRLERVGFVETTDFLTYPVGPQQIAHPPARANDAQDAATGANLCMQLLQHARAGQINVERCREVTNQHPKGQASTQTAADG